jgi:FG-GAP-like repeat
LEDMDNDGLKDLIGINREFINNGYPIYYYKRLNSDTFDTTARISTVPNNNSTVRFFGDVNNDGKKDVIVSLPGATLSFVTYLNDGTGRFLTATTPVVAELNTERIIAVADLNNDGKSDLVTTTEAGSQTSAVYYRLTQANNSFGPSVLISLISGYIQTAINVEDFNGDGLKDILYYNNQGNFGLNMMINSPNLNFTRITLTGYYPSIQFADFNNDGKKDFTENVTQQPNIYKIKVSMNNGNNNFSSFEITVPFDFSDANYGDFDGDQKTDILLFARYENRGFFLRNQGNNTFTGQEFRRKFGENSIDAVDLDGKNDAVSMQRGFVDRTLGTGNSTYLIYNAVAFNKNVCNPVGQTKIVDFNGDGFIDRAFWNPTTGYWRYYTGTAQTDQVYFQFGLGSLGDVPVPNDYDGDGKTDYAIYRKSTGTWYIYRTSDQQYTIFRFGLAEDKPVPADFDGDDKADIAVYRPSDGNWYIWLSQTNQFYAAHFGTAEDKPIPADYDGDGKADIAVYRPTGGVWYRINSSNSSYSVIQYGISTDKLVPGDFDGDGKINIGVFRDGVWYLLKDNFSTSVFFFGQAGDIPLFGTEEGYGYDYLAVYRRSSNRFYGNAYDPYNVGNTANETFVSTILPNE